MINFSFKINLLLDEIKKLNLLKELLSVLCKVELKIAAG